MLRSRGVHWILLLALYPLLGAAGQSAAAPPRAAADTNALLDSLIAAERRFLARWQLAWAESERDRHSIKSDSTYAPYDRPGSGRRHGQYHCDFSAELLQHDPRPTRIIGTGRLIKSEVTAFAVCPGWSHETAGPPWDERLGIDQGLTPDRRAVIRDARASLLARFEAATAILPANNWLVGQRIRFLLDQHEPDDALAAAQACRATPWWCTLLTGYVHTVRGELTPAEAHFAAARGLLAGQARCDWLDVRSLLEFEAWTAYTSATCTERDLMTERLWWLADPLWTESGNDRRVEHEARRALVLLKTALPRDERFDWRASTGGDARAEMVMRYGWPAFHFWGGPDEDRYHSRDHLVAPRWDPERPASPPNEPYTTYEYSRGRQHLLPESRVLLAPYAAQWRDWSLGAPFGSDTAMPQIAKPVNYNWNEAARTAFEMALRQQDVAFIDYQRRLWWPVEHYAAPRRLVQLPEGQVVVLRRDDHLILATATDVAPDSLERAPGDTLQATLVLTHHPDSITAAATTAWTASDGVPLILSADISPRPTLVGIEIPGLQPTTPAGRTRFGLTPPPTLSAMVPGTRAISAPVLLRAPAPDVALPTTVDGVLPLLAASTTLAAGGRLGVYWETYGIAPTDSVELAVWIERTTPQSPLRRLGISLGVATDRNTPIVIRWREARAGAGATVLPGPVPVIARSLTLDTSTLIPGDYRLEIAVQRPGEEALRTRAQLVVR